MMKRVWARRLWATSGMAAVLSLWGCGGDAGLGLVKQQCGGGRGLQIRGVVAMPGGRVAQAGNTWERFAGAVWSEAAAITGAIQPVGSGVDVSLVELRQDDPHGDPGAIAVVSTDENGEYCIGLPQGTDETVCRYVLQVGSRDDDSLTRAFVFSNDDPFDIDFRSEAVVRLVLAQIPPTTLCEFSPSELQTIYDAVDAAPGNAIGNTAAEINAVAASIASLDPGVDAAISAAYNRAPTRTPTPTVGPATATPTGPTPTRTEIVRRTDTPTPRATRTPVGATATAARPPTRTATAIP
jgi:hypothetical protein